MLIQSQMTKVRKIAIGTPGSNPVGGSEALLLPFRKANNMIAERMARIPLIRRALSVEMSAPHAVVALGEENELEAAAFTGLTDSAAPVVYDPVPEAGTNLELVVPLGEEIDPDTQSPVGIARMRVLERGVGETLSYAAGCCAVAVALHAWTGPGAPEDYRLLVPGGEIGVHVGASPLGEDSTVLLTGPATITGRVTIA